MTLRAATVWIIRSTVDCLLICFCPPLSVPYVLFVNSGPRAVFLKVPNQVEASGSITLDRHLLYRYLEKGINPLEMLVSLERVRKK